MMFRNCHIDHALPMKAGDLPGGVEALRFRFGLSQDFEIDGFQNWVPACQRCNLTKGVLMLDHAPATMSFMPRIRGKAPLAEAIADAIDRDAKKKAPLLAKVEAAVSVGDITAAEIEELMAGIPSVRERLQIAPNWDIIEYTGGQVVMRMGLSILYWTEDIKRSAGNPQLNATIAGAIEELQAQIGDVNRRVMDLEGKAHHHHVTTPSDQPDQERQDGE